VNRFRIHNGDFTEILVGARSQRLGKWSIPDFRLRYRVGDRHYETSYGQGMKVRVVPRPEFAHSSASFASFQTEAHNIRCAFVRATKAVRCDLRSGPCYELKIVGRSSVCAAGTPPTRSGRVLQAGASWLYHGFRCYAGHANIRCRNQRFEGFFLSERRSHRT
jgi:hypothetical protein